jgi:hypothetical protein
MGDRAVFAALRFLTCFGVAFGKTSYEEGSSLLLGLSGSFWLGDLLVVSYSHLLNLPDRTLPEEPIQRSEHEYAEQREHVDWWYADVRARNSADHQEHHEAHQNTSRLESPDG